VVIGGLVGDDIDVSTSKVPCLGDIPLIGWLFRSENRTTRRTNLLIFLTPHIVVSPEEADKIYKEKSTYIESLTEGAKETAEEHVEKKSNEQPAEDNTQPTAGGGQ
jgi:general secretion pathway protein D